MKKIALTTLDYPFFLLFLLAFLGACDGVKNDVIPDSVSCQLNREISLQYGQSTDCGVLGLRFTGAIEESRCPINSTIKCAFAGIATIHLTVNGQEDIPLTIQGPNTPFELSRDTIDGQVIELLEVLPVPEGERFETEKENFRISIRVTAL